MGPEKLVDDLRKDLAAGRVLVVAGTGVSIQASGGDPRASWAGLIRDGIDYSKRVGVLSADDAKALNEQLDANKNDPVTLLKIANRIQKELKAGDFRQWLQESVGALRLEDREIIHAIHALNSRLATTNYDNLLSRGRDFDAVPWTDSNLALELINDDRKGVLHLHGYYDVPDSVILGIESYAAIRDAKRAQAIQQIVAARSTLLFIGCGDGLSDPNFGALLDWVATTFSGSKYRHYCLCLESEAATLSAKHPGLSFITYGTSYDELVPALRDLAPPRLAPSSLPPAGRCLGRTREVRTLVAALLKKNPEPIPILGGAGMGKTTIALEALHDPKIASRFATRRWFIRCDGVKTRAELVAAIARALGLHLTPNIELIVLTELANGPAVLVVDNAETPLDADKDAIEEFLATLAGIDTLALVVTIRGLHRPLTVPWGSTIEARPLDDKTARDAFVASAGRKSFARDPQLSQLLDALEGVPLAITLMGHFAQSFTALKPVWDRWTEKKTAMLRVGTDRLNNIEVSYELSIGALNSEARRLLSVLALLPDGVAHVDLSGIFADPEQSVDVLRDRALVEHEETRLRMLAPLREYVAAAHAPEPADERRVVQHYLALAVEGERVGSIGGAAAVARLAPEVGNAEAMLVRSADIDPQIVGAAVYGCAELMRFTGLGSVAAINAILERAVVADVPKLAAQCSRSLGDIMLRRSNHDSARDLFQQAIPLYRRVGDPYGEAICIKSLGNIAFERSDHDSAREFFERALPLFKEIGAVLGEANCIKSLGNIALRRFDYDSATEFFQRALPLYQEVDDLLGEANCTVSLGSIALERLDYDSAREHFEQALFHYEKIGARLGEANCIQRLGDIALQRSDLDSAYQNFQRALVLYKKIGDVLGEGNSIQRLGNIAIQRSNYNSARDLFQQALTKYEQIPEPYSIGATHLRLARIANGAAEKNMHVDAARNAWRGIKRDDLVAKLDAEFGAD